MFTSNTTYNNLLKQYNYMVEQLHHAEKANEKLDEEKIELQEKLNYSNQVRASLGVEKLKLEKNEKSLEGANGELKLKITTLQDKLVKAGKNKDDLLNMMRDGDKERAKLAAEVERLDRCWKEDADDLIEKAKELTYWKEQHKELEEKLSDANKALDSMTKRHESQAKRNADVGMQLAASRAREIALMEGVKALEERNEVLEEREKRRREWAANEKRKQQKLVEDAEHWAKVNAFMTNPNKYAIKDDEAEKSMVADIKDVSPEPEKLIEPMDEDEA